MSKPDFLAKLTELLELDTPLTGEEALADLEAWDSMAVLTFMAMADEETGKTLAVPAIASAKTVNELYELLAA
jgi:acyl carrier protein